MPVDQTGEQNKGKHETFIHVHVFDRHMWDMNHDKEMTHIIQFNRVTGESCYTWVMSHTCVSYVTDSYAWHDSCERFASCVSLWVMSMSRGTHERESWYTYAWVMPYLCIIHVSLMNKDECVICFFLKFACLINWHTKKRETWLIDHMIHFKNPWHTCLCLVIHVTRGSCHTHAWVMSLIHTRDMSHLNGSCLVCLYELCLILTCVMSHDWFERVPWLI